MAKEQIQKVSHLEHILLRPDSYVGSTEKTAGPYWILEDEKFYQKTLVYPPALLKIFDEILVNAIDRNSLHPTEVKNIEVAASIESGIIMVENNGPLGGISVEKHPTEGIWNPELTFGHLLTSTNYDDETERVVGGRNGYGAKLANVYSSTFQLTIKDHVNGQKYVQKWEKNMTICGKPKITKYSGKTSSVNICFVPDWEKFGMTSMTNDVFKIIEKRVWDALVCTNPKCAITFQGKKLKKLSFENYAKMYLEDDAKLASISQDRWQVIISPSDTGFQQVSFVNGICTTKGGSHVDHVSSYVSSGIIDALGKKIQLRPAHIKSSMFVFVKSTLVNPTFSSQVKSECTLKVSNFGSTFDCTSAFVKSVLKTGIQDELISISKFREQKELKKTDGSRKSKITGIPKLDDANFAGTSKSEQATLILTEGDSAKTLAIAGLSVVGRDKYGVFPLRGKFKNVRDASVKQLLTNEEFTNIKKIVGLQQGVEYTSLSQLRYGRLMIMTDADHDGSHIKGLILNMIHYFWPSLLNLGFLVSMVTPIIKATKGKQTQSFYTESAFREWYDPDRCKGWNIKYYKGLGTSTSKEAQEYFKNINNLTVQFEVDDLTQKSIVLAFDKKRADYRKKWLLEGSEKKPGELEVKYGSIKSLGITDFIHKDLINFSLADLKRSIAHLCDGFKPSQRKVIYTCLKKNITKDIKVAQLAAVASEFTSYHHGEVSMADTIVKLAQDYVASNNMNFLSPKGQFGTRLMGGKDASQTRYIFTHLSPSTRKVFDSTDDPVLNYLDDDGNMIEPEYYVPILPTILVNGSEGIGTGFSCYVPPYNPDDIKANITRCLEGKDLVAMTPWFKGFKGSVGKNSDDSWVAVGTYEYKKNNIVITELPPGKWTQDFKEFLDSMAEKGTISSYKNNSTTEEVNFEISGYDGTDPIKDFKLSKTIHTSNMHLFHPTKGIRKYASPEDILVDFIEIRVDFYKKRKAHLLKTMEHDMQVISNKSRFIQMVVDDEITIFRQKKAAIESNLVKHKFDKMDESYDYLLNIKTYQYTEEAIAKLDAEVEDIKKRLDSTRNTNVVTMWKSDILKC